MKKIQRHDPNSVNNPPSAGPIDKPIETLTELRPSAVPRSRTPKVLVTMAGPIACNIAAPMAWTARNPTSIQTLCDMPHNALAPAKSPKPTR